MMCLLEHAKHGRMHVYSQYDLDRHMRMGWKLVEETKASDPAPRNGGQRRKSDGKSK